jgi:hypothetical protein
VSGSPQENVIFLSLGLTAPVNGYAFDSFSSFSFDQFKYTVLMFLHD